MDFLVFFFKSYKSGNKKQKQQQAWCLESSTFGFLSLFWGDWGRWSLLKLPRFSIHPPWQKLHSRRPPLPLFRFLMKVGATGQPEIHGPHVSLTPGVGLETLLPGGAFRPLPHCRQRLELTAFKVEQPRSREQLKGPKRKHGSLGVISGVLIARRTRGLRGGGGWGGWGRGRGGGKVHPW